MGAGARTGHWRLKGQGPAPTEDRPPLKCHFVISQPTAFGTAGSRHMGPRTCVTLPGGRVPLAKLLFLKAWFTPSHLQKAQSASSTMKVPPWNSPPLQDPPGSNLRRPQGAEHAYCCCVAPSQVRALGYPRVQGDGWRRKEPGSCQQTGLRGRGSAGQVPSSSPLAWACPQPPCAASGGPGRGAGAERAELQWEPRANVQSAWPLARTGRRGG